ncbi:hypothetical protein RGI97_002816 [Serratia marcescens]
MGLVTKLNDGFIRLAQLIKGKQDALTFDEAPTQDSDNPVTSGGVYGALQLVGGGDPWGSVDMTLATGGRQFGIPFTLSEEKPALATYTFDTSIPNTAGGYVEITVYVNGAITARARVAQAASSATGSTQRQSPITVFIPKGAPVVISTSATTGATVSLYRRQEVIF